jgi:hypothetical protein
MKAPALAPSPQRIDPRGVTPGRAELRQVPLDSVLRHGAISLRSLIWSALGRESPNLSVDSSWLRGGLGQSAIGSAGPLCQQPDRREASSRPVGDGHRSGPGPSSGSWGSSGLPDGPPCRARVVAARPRPATEISPGSKRRSPPLSSTVPWSNDVTAASCRRRFVPAPEGPSRKG